MTLSVEIPKSSNVEWVSDSTDHHRDLRLEQVEDGPSNPSEQRKEAIENGIGSTGDLLTRWPASSCSKTCQGEVYTGQTEQNCADDKILVPWPVIFVRTASLMNELILPVQPKTAFQPQCQRKALNTHHDAKLVEMGKQCRHSRSHLPLCTY